MNPMEIPKELIEANLCQLEAFGAFTAAVLTNAERMTKLGLDFAEAVLADGTAQAEALMGAKLPASTPRSVELSIGYPRKVMDAGLEASRNMLETFEGEIQKQCALMAGLAQRTTHAKGHPYDLNPMMKATFDSVNTLFETLAKSSRQALEMTENGLAAAAHSTAAATAAAHPAHGKKVA